MSQDYRFERVMEHRQQIWSLKRTHLFPDLGRASVGGLEKKRDIDVDELNQNQELRRLARAFGLHPEELVDKYDDTRREVRHLHLDIYYRPMLPVNAQMENDQIVLSVEAAQERFESIGFGDPDAAIRHVQALTAGVRAARAKINRIILPAVLQWLGAGPEPGHGPAQLAQTGGELRHRIRLPRLPARLHLRRPAPVPHPVQLTIPGRRAQQVGRIDQLAWRRRQSAGPHARGLGRADRLGAGTFRLRTSTSSPPPCAPCAATKSNASACLG